MADSAALAISYGAYSQKGNSGWITGNNELYAARNGAGEYFYTKLGFNTNGLNIKKSNSLTLRMTTSSPSNPYGTSAILTTSELTPTQLHSLSTESAVTSVAGYVAHAHCASHTSSATIAAGTEATYILDTDAIKADTQYYIYIRRRIGVSDSTTGTNGWTEFHNPCYSDSLAAYSSITLDYEAGGFVRIDNGSSLAKYIPYIDNGSGFVKYVPYIDNGTTWEKYSG